MITGNGSFVLSQRSVPSGGGMPAPPFAANSAVNGLSVNGAGQIVLGDDIGGVLAALLSDREIEMSGFLFQFIDGGLPKFQIDNATPFYGLGDFTTFNDPALLMNNAGGDRSIQMVAGNVAATEYATYEMGNDTGGNESFVKLRANQGPGVSNRIELEKDNILLELGNSNMQFYMDDTANSMKADFGGFEALKLDRANNFYGIGDTVTNSLPVLILDDQAGDPIIWSFISDGSGGTPNAYQEMSYQLGNPRFIWDIIGNTDNVQMQLNESVFFIDYSNTGKWLEINTIAGTAKFGDADVAANGTRLEIDDTGRLVQIFAGATRPLLFLDGANNSYALGDLNGVAAQTYFYLDDFGMDIKSNAEQVLALDAASKVYRIGDITPAQNGTRLEINDNTNTFNFDNTAHNAGININGVAGFTGTVTPVTSITVNNGIVTNVV
jgi:hypothetical protein